MSTSRPAPVAPWLRRQPAGHPLLRPRFLVAALLLLAILGLLAILQALASLQAEASVTHEALIGSRSALRRAETERQAVDADLVRARAELATVTARLPNEVDQLALLSDLRAAAARVDLEIVRLEPVVAEVGAGPGAAPPTQRYRVGLDGSEAGLRAFLEAVPGLPYPTLAVEAVGVTPKGMQVTLAIGLRPPSPPTPTPAPRPPVGEPASRTGVRP